jgi:phosphoglycolate phosphatase-like HAD superfamily hydrolase
VLTGGAGVRAMSHAFEDLFGITDGFRGVHMSGRTDSSILLDAAQVHQIPATSPRLAEFPRIYAIHLARELDQPGPRKGVMPGIRSLLDALSPRGDVHLALLTGNYETTAQLKLEYFDLWRYFRGGAFGDDAPDRNRLLPRAVKHVATTGGPCVALGDAVIIGDTPLDVACAQASGARSIAVATGMYTTEELRAAGADVVFEDLSDTNAVLAALISATNAI